MSDFSRSAAILLVSLSMTLFASGCATSQASKPAEDPFAAYSIDEIMAAGDKALAANEPERAVFIYMQALEIEQNAETWYRIGIGKARLGDKAYAWQALKKAVELDPEHEKSHQELGLIYMAMGQPEQAEIHLKKATELDETLWRAWNGLGVIADVAKRYPEAVENYTAGLIGAPNSALLMNNIGYSYYLAGDLQEASRWFGRAILAQPNYAPAVKNLALLYARQGWYEEAVKTFAKVVTPAQANNDVGYIAMRNSDYEEASEMLTAAIRLSPTYYEKAHENLDALKKAIKEERNKDKKAAIIKDTSEVVFPDGKDVEFKSVAPRALNVRAAPDSDSEIVNYLKAGDEVQVIMTLPGWAFVNYRPGTGVRGKEMTGWVNSNYLDGPESAKAANAVQGNEPPAATAVEAPKNAGNPSANAVDATHAPEKSQPDSKPQAAPAAALPDTATAAETPTSLAADFEPEPAMQATDPEIDFIRSIDAVCNPETGSQKTPLSAGSCVGVAAADADE
ncbi:MAG: tetratricopeptide repeat protein [Gammaproteobacteria bacterium]|jgi:tetratricopeptide (TPR) repeat protein